MQGPNVLIQLQADLRQGAAGIDGSMDIPQQGASKLPLRALRFEGGRAHFELSTGAAPGIFDGVFAGDSMSGSYTQGPFQGTFRLVRTGAAAPLPPAEPVPYREEEVTFHDGEVALAGTLTLPPGPGRHPAVVMVTGSGPQNRDEEIFSFKPFRLIADHLTRHGIAVLRYDDRGVGKSTGDFSAATTADFADDARAAVRYLMGRAEVDTAHIGVCGHSEGGL
ncbi:MAG TPA: alpha/beta hydrolase, partial [Candidatus Saccharimonadales bacterium]|nr:alpha/beta hydrolase [Candidatus Saccharimonadales bacterium]